MRGGSCNGYKCTYPVMFSLYQGVLHDCMGKPSNQGGAIVTLFSLYCPLNYAPPPPPPPTHTHREIRERDDGDNDEEEVKGEKTHRGPKMKGEVDHKV